MKRKLLFFFVLLSTIYTWSQEVEGITYRFLNPAVTNKIELYKKAFSTADMTRFRFKDKSNIIAFENGLKVEIFSANQLIQNGIQVDASKLANSSLENNGYTFKITEDGKYILQQYTQKEFKSRKKIKAKI